MSEAISPYDQEMRAEVEFRNNNQSKPGPANFDRAATWKGRVVNNSDPKRLGRIQVEVPGVLDGSTGSVWCNPRTGNNFANSGSWIIPPIGSTVFIDFEGGDVNHPLYSTGGLSGSEGEVIAESVDRAPEGTNSEVFYRSGGSSVVVAEHLVLEDAYVDNEENDHNSYVDIIHRTTKGSVIKIDERDERESLSVIDRIGNLLKFVSPVDIRDNESNMSVRSAKQDASRTIDPETLKNLKVNQKFDWFILLKMMQGSTIRILEGLKNHLVVIKSKYTNYEDNSVVEPSITIQSFPSEGISLKVSGSEIFITPSSISIQSGGGSVVVTGGKISVNGDLHVSGSISSGGAINSGGAITGQTVASGSISLDSHIHLGVMAGGDSTQGPQGGGSSGAAASPTGSSAYSPVLDTYDTDVETRKINEFIPTTNNELFKIPDENWNPDDYDYPKLYSD